MLKKWQKLPIELQHECIAPYYKALKKKRLTLIFKRLFDILFSFILLILASPFFLVLSIVIVIDSHGAPFYLQERVTQYGKKFRIIKFRTMVKNAAKMGSEVTVSDDPRITKTGKFIRRFRIDEVPQLINIVLGQMTFVGTRPEVPRYVEGYSAEMLATLLLPAGVTSRASIEYSNEQELLDGSTDIDKTYVEEILPEKMKYNLAYLQNFSCKEDFLIIFLTVKKVFFGG
ncbi:MAG: sugar transferase [Clostridiaceae bacterium]|nr:sugar transferase [Clostridiaceae bacterium]